MAKDLFSAQAAGYARYRPGYPEELIQYVLSFVTGRQAAWDCATGNGQAAILLAPHFSRIEATDISDRQLAQAVQHPSIHYSQSPETQTTFEDNTFDLITVAQAYHWFSFDGFHQEATRVSRPGAIVAVWGYGLITTPDEQLEDRIRSFYTSTVGQYWDPERKYVDESYQTIPFPFTALPSREFNIHMQWSRIDLLGYLNTWSSVQHFIKANGYNPIGQWAETISPAWKAEETRQFTFPLFCRIGKVEK
jgi:hypothetical protein